MVKDIRFRSEKYTKKIITPDLYLKWVEEYPEYSKYSYKEFCNFWKLLANEYTDTVCDNSHGAKLHFNNGQLVLKYTNSSGFNKNYKISKLANEPVGHLNLVSSGKNGKIVWSTAQIRKINPELPLIAFQACRNFTVKASKAFVDTPELFKITKASAGNIKNIIKKHNKNVNK